ncbi:MAG TPA: formate dehydrogenase accessory sulfurtransferase FdhD [Methanothermococcus okinawensis]|uniref:Sulfur carrier protein FdhD n=1 Tax=Methanothermococcus okinawensis TaxID=155863 RepID=A0A832YT40_9EURY|nr:formate dehydrogenase accessory sulfurtransferase FdhD [Methanothermococcus okinawensis]
MIKKLSVLVWKGTPEIKEDYICIERDYNIYINNKKISKITASPENLKELGVGHTIAEGYLKGVDVKDVHIEDNNIVVNTHTSNSANNETGNCERYLINKVPIKLPLSTILNIMEDMLRDKKIWELTGGTHWACLYDLNGNKIVSIEDIGRHSAVDKVIGYGILRGINLRDKILVSSGRQPYMMVNKAMNANIPVIISKSPSMDRGVELARKNNLILIGFARRGRFTVYSGHERILFNQ